MPAGAAGMVVVALSFLPSSHALVCCRVLGRVVDHQVAELVQQQQLADKRRRPVMSTTTASKRQVISSVGTLSCG